MSHLDISLVDIFDEYNVSRRLRNIVHAIDSTGLGVKTLKDYLERKSEYRQVFEHWRGVGAKMIAEFDETIHRSVSRKGASFRAGAEQQAGVPEDISLLDLLDRDNISQRLRNIIVAASKNQTIPFATVGDYLKNERENRKILSEMKGFGVTVLHEFDEAISLFIATKGESFRARARHLDELSRDISLAELFEKANVSKRLQNKIHEILENQLTPFKTVSEYLANERENRKILSGTRGLGDTVLQEFDEVIGLYIATNGKLLEENALKLAEPLIESAKIIDQEYPGIFQGLTSAIYALRENPSVDASEVSRLKKAISVFLKNPERTQAIAGRFNGKTLEEAAKSLNVTRERLRQIETIYKPFVTDFAAADWAKEQLSSIDSFRDGSLPTDSEMDATHRLLRSSLRKQFVDPDAGIKPLSNVLNDRERLLISEGLGVALDKETADRLDQRWTLDKVIRETRALAEQLGKPDLMPLQHEQVTAGKTSLRGAIGRFGGQSKIAELSGLKYQGQLVGEDGSRIYWTDERIKSFLTDVAKANGHPEEMPTYQECMSASATSPHIIANLTQSNSALRERRRSWIELAELAGLRIPKGGHRKTLGYIKAFVQSLGDALDTLTPAEVFVLFEQQNLTKTGENRYRNRSFDNLVEAIQSGYLPSSVVKDWASGVDSDLIENLLDPSIETVQEAFSAAGRELPKKKRLSKPLLENEELEDVEQHLPIPSTLDTLKALDKATTILERTSSDEDAVQFLVAKAASKLWARCFDNEAQSISDANNFSGNVYSNEAKDRFLKEYENSKSLSLPTGYQFKNPDGVVVYPKLMQRLIAYKVMNDRRVLNLSGTGTGKTLSAVLASRVIDSKLTVISCPNSTVTGWVKTIKNAFPDSEVITKTLDPIWETNLPKYLVLNHEIFQDRSEQVLQEFIQNSKIDFIVIDELHQVKQRDERFESQRRRLMTKLIAGHPDNGEKPRVLGLSATPVINNLYEGKSLIELVEGREESALSSDTTIENCMRLYQKFTTMGFRMMPSASIDRMPRITEIDASSAISELCSLGRRAHPQQIEAVLVRERWPAIKAALRKKTVIFTDYVKDVVPFLAKSVSEAGFTVGCFTGDDKEATELGFHDMLDQFIRGDLDVLIASIKTAGTGVDGLQHICNNVIFATLPWTSTDYEQAVGRFDREGMKFSSLEIHIPKTFAYFGNGERWSWCESKLARIENKRDIAKAAVDGEIPDSQAQLTPQQATKYWLNWLERLNHQDSMNS